MAYTLNAHDLMTIELAADACSDLVYYKGSGHERDEIRDLADELLDLAERMSEAYNEMVSSK